MACESTFNIQSARVRSILGVSADTDVSAAIEAASAVVNDLLDSCAAGRWDAKRASLIGAWLAAHFYSMTHVDDASVQSKSVNGASKSYSRVQAGEGFMATPYGRNAVSLDSTGCLRTFDTDSRRRSATVYWAGDVSDPRRPSWENS